MWIVEPLEYTEWGQNTEWKMCKNIDTCTHINHLGTRLCVQLWGKTRKSECVCVCVCVVAACNACVLIAGSCSCVWFHPELPSSHQVPQHFPPSSLSFLPRSFCPLWAQSDPTILLFSATPPHASIFTSSPPVFLLQNNLAGVFGSVAVYTAFPFNFVWTMWF